MSENYNDSESEKEEATPEQKLSIATYFIMSSPIGEVDFVTADTQKLIGDNDILDNKSLTNILKDYNVEQMISAPTPDGKKCLVSTFGMVKANQYMDPNAEKIYEFDHIKREFGQEIKGVEHKLDESISSLRQAVQQQLDDYIGDKYKEGKACGVVYANNDTKDISICIHASNTKISAFWTGGWNSVYTFNMDESSGKKVEMVGNVKIHVHYFEDGNVQLHAAVEKKAEIEISEGDDVKTAKSVVKAIDKIETDYQNHLEVMYIDMHKNTFKNVRRGLPISGELMNWNIAAHGVGRAK